MLLLNLLINTLVAIIRKNRKSVKILYRPKYLDLEKEVTKIYSDTDVIHIEVTTQTKGAKRGTPLKFNSDRYKRKFRTKATKK